MDLLQRSIPGRTNAASVFVGDNVRAGWGERTAIIDAASGAEDTYREVLANVNRAGNVLRDPGVRMLAP